MYGMRCDHHVIFMKMIYFSGCVALAGLETIALHDERQRVVGLDVSFIFSFLPQVFREEFKPSK